MSLTFRHCLLVALALAVLGADSPGVITTRQRLATVQFRRVFAGRLLGVTFGKTDSEIAALSGGFSGSALTWYRWQDRATLATIRVSQYPTLPGMVFDARTDAALISTTSGDPSRVQLLAGGTSGAPRVVANGFGSQTAGAPAVATNANASGERLAVVPLTFDNRVAIIDVRTGRVLGRVTTGIAPYGAAIDARGTTAYVTNWGGRFSHAGDLTGTSGVVVQRGSWAPGAGRDAVVVDSRGIASTGSVVRVDLQTMRATNVISVGRQPTALTWDQEHARLYVASSNDDTISVIDTGRNVVVQTISLSRLGHGFGVGPLALVLSRDGTNLFVACAGINAVAVIDTAAGTILGAIPTDWYPDDLALSPSGKYLAVGTLFGIGSGWNDPGAIKEMATDLGQKLQVGPGVRYVHIYRGTVDVFAIPTTAQLTADTYQVYLNDNDLEMTPRWVPPPIHYVVYIIKENRSYDQLFGDMGKGNSDPSLVVFGRKITPNHHQLADDFVLLDNFYATGGNSGDGHQWVTQGNETPYTMLGGDAGRSYPFDGTDPIAYSKSGFIWNDFLNAGLSVQDFGEFAGVEDAREHVIAGSDHSYSAVRLAFFHQWLAGAAFTNVFHVVAPIAPLNRILVSDFPAYGGTVPDVVRARIFLRHLKLWSATGRMPNLVLVQLPSDHTGGFDPGYATPPAALADNDYALGQIVDGLSHSRFWKSMAIFVVEDDAQGGVDHVDGHRTIALLISPYVRRGSVDSTFYSHPSMLKTMEEFFGLHPMTLFDTTANDMRESFTSVPDFRPYTAIKSNVPLLEINPRPAALQGPARAAAIASEKMNFSVPDAAPPDAVNQMLWHAMRGWNVPYPKNGGRP